MDKFKYSVGFTSIDVMHTVTPSGKPLLLIDLPGPGSEIAPQKARDLATLLKIAADAVDPPQKVDVGLYATIREESKYKCQQETDEFGRPVPFPVTIQNGSGWLGDGYLIEGGPGGRYTLYDVHLWTNVTGEFKTLPVHGSPYPINFIDMYEVIAKTKHKMFSPEWEIDQVVKRIEDGQDPLALSTSERIASSIIYDHPEWRPEPYTDLNDALERLGAWRDATLRYRRIHGCRSWKG